MNIISCSILGTVIFSAVKRKFQKISENRNSNKEDFTLLLKIAGILNAHGLKTIDAGFICRVFNKTHRLLTHSQMNITKWFSSVF